jgi:hypothetical protein
MVVSPRQLNPLTKFDKSWAGKPMAIEDPFKLSHNLASGVGRKSKCLCCSVLTHLLSLCVYVLQCCSEELYSGVFCTGKATVWEAAL